MELRVLKYFLEVARKGKMTSAAESLYVSQPALSKQIKDLEKELGRKLFRRGSRSVSLTEEGLLLYKRAEDIVALAEKTKEEFQSLGEIQGGDLHIGCAESFLIKHLAEKIKALKNKYPLVRYHLTSGDSDVVTDRLDRGLLDFAVIVEPPDMSKYNYVQMPGHDTWCAIMPATHRLAKKKRITADDLIGEELICSEQSIRADIPRWCGEKADRLNFTGHTNLAYNGAVFVREGLGIMLALANLIQTPKKSGICSRPLEPPLSNSIYLIWRKKQAFAPIAALLLEEFRKAGKQSEKIL